MKNILLLILVLVLFVLGGAFYFLSMHFPEREIVNSPVDELPPEKILTEPSQGAATSSVVLPKPPVTAAQPCFVGGCSSQICSDQQDIVSTCEWRESYACYQSASCERQQNGQCGWTQTSELALCLSQAQ